MSEQQEPSDETGYYHRHVRMTLDLCLAMDINRVDKDEMDTRNPLYDGDGMPAATKAAYQGLIKAIMTDPQTRLRLLATMAIEEAYNLYHNNDDILTELLEDGELVPDLVNDEEGRVELGDLAEPHLVDDKPYQWLRINWDEVTFTFNREEADVFDPDPLHNALISAIAHLSFQEIEPDD